MKNTLGLAAAVIATTVSLGGVMPAFAAEATSVTQKDAHNDAYSSVGAPRSAPLDIYVVKGAKVGKNIRLTMTVDQLPRTIKDASVKAKHLAIGVATSNSGNGAEPTKSGKVKVGGVVCKGSHTTYNFKTDTVKMVLALKCVGGGAKDQRISGFTYNGDTMVDSTKFSKKFNTK